MDFQKPRLPYVILLLGKTTVSSKVLKNYVLKVIIQSYMMSTVN